MRIVFIIILCFQLHINAQAQRIHAADLPNLQTYNDTLGKLGGLMLDALTPPERLRYDSMFTVNLVKALQTPFSYYFPFDSILTAPIVYPADSSFRIITWHYEKDGGDYRQKGAIQYNTPDGSLKLTPLYDYSDFASNVQDSVRDNRHWIGAIYYNIITKAVAGKKVYFLLGYDENNMLTTRKWIEPLQFDEQGNAVLGGDFFDVGNDSIFPAGSRRYKVEFKKYANARVNYDAQQDLIVMDNLISQTNEPDKLYTLVPGGDYEGLKWENGKWKFIDRLFVDNLGDGNEPRPALILSEAGLPNEDVLGKQSEKNKQQEEAKKKKKGQ